MFGAEYSRMKFWLSFIAVIVFGAICLGMIGNTEYQGIASQAEYHRALLGSLVVQLVVIVALIHILANRIRGFGSNPWLALLSLLPFVFLLQALYYGCKESATVTKEES